MIILTKQQAEAVRGKYGAYSALDPVQIAGEFYGLPDSILESEIFSEAHETLKDLPRIPDKNYAIKIVAPEMLLMEYSSMYNWFMLKGLPIVSIEDKAILFCNEIQPQFKPLFDNLQANNIIEVYEQKDEI